MELSVDESLGPDGLGDGVLDEALATTTGPDAADMADLTATLGDPMDELFNEAAGGLDLNVALPAPPTLLLSPALRERISQTQRGGCCTRLAWSNTGCIARVSGPEGNKIELSTVCRDAKTGEWNLSDSSAWPIEIAGGRSFVHVQFDGLGQALAAVDEVGMVQLYDLAGVLGRLQAANVDVPPGDVQHSELTVVVGLYWLPLYPMEFRAPYITPATKLDGRWVTQTKNAAPTASRVHHPVEARRALIYVTRNSRLTLMYQTETAAWQAVSTELSSCQHSDQLLTHAALGENFDHLLLVTHDQRRRFRVYKLSINWNAAQQSRNNVSYVSVAPVINLVHLTVDDGVAPSQGDAELTVLSIIPRVPDLVQSDIATATTVMAVFTSITLQQEPYSVVSRWTVHSESPIMHDCFTKSKATAAMPEQATVTRLMREPDIVISRPVLSVQVFNHNTQVLFGLADGTTETRARSTWSLPDAYDGPNIISSLAQCSLAFEPLQMGVSELALNTDGCAMICVNSDKKMAVRYVSPRYGWAVMNDGISDTASLIDAAIFCLAREYSTLCALTASNDEVVAALPFDLSRELRVLFVQCIMRIICRLLDCSMLDQQKQQHTVFRESLHIKPLSVQLILGTQPHSLQRDFPAQFAYAYLNLRHISMAMTQVFTRESHSPNRPPDLVPSLVGLVRWTMDLQVFVVDTLFEMKRQLDSSSEDVSALISRYIAETGTPALHLILCSFPRALMRMQTVLIPTYLKWIQASLQGSRARTLAQRQDMESLYQRAKEMPFMTHHFTEFMADFDAAVRSAYQESNAGGEKRTELEILMLTEGALPTELLPAITTLFTTILPKLRSATNTGKLFFWDTDWLGITTVAPKTRYDAIRKIPLTKGMKLRRCRRCGAEMEDLSAETARQGPEWLRLNQRYCFCQGYWWPIG